MLRDTLEQLPPQLTESVLASASAGNAPTLDAARSFIQKLPESHVHEPGSDCPICLSAMTSDIVALPCGSGRHCFHRECILDWAKLSTRCPLCREGFGNCCKVKQHSAPCSPVSSRVPSVAELSVLSETPSVRNPSENLHTRSNTRDTDSRTISRPPLLPTRQPQQHNLLARLQPASKPSRSSSEPRSENRIGSAASLGVVGSEIARQASSGHRNCHIRAASREAGANGSRSARESRVQTCGKVSEVDRDRLSHRSGLPSCSARSSSTPRNDEVSESKPSYLPSGSAQVASAGAASPRVLDNTKNLPRRMNKKYMQNRASEPPITANSLPCAVTVAGVGCAQRQHTRQSTDVAK